MMILRLGWRNLWRNPRRSLITISAVATASGFLIAFIGLMAGMVDQMLSNGTGLLTGQVQVHSQEFLPDRNLFDWMEAGPGDGNGFLEELRQVSGVEAATPRVLGFGLLSTGEHSAGAQIIGVDPGQEDQVSSLISVVSAGASLSNSPGEGILLGSILARTLGATVGSEIAVVSQAADGSLGNDLYLVRGIFRTGMVFLDRSLAVFHWRDLQQLLALQPAQVHEVVLRIDDPMAADNLAGRLRQSEILPESATARSWTELLPQLGDMINMVGGFNWFLTCLVGLFAGIGVLNTMLMAVFERTREVGTLAALGMSPFQILNTFLVESFLIALLGVGAGFLFGLAMMQYLTTSGLDLTRWTAELSFADTRMDPILRAEWVWGQVVWAGLGLVLCLLLATCIAAVRAARMDPVQALYAATEG
jgi:ABC-type lipoprotein release transport system permease subunit